MGASKTASKKIVTGSSAPKRVLQFSKKPRKATFAVKTVGGKRVFTPVNKRAKSSTEAFGVKHLDASHLKAIKAYGWAPYTSVNGVLKAISL